MTEVLANGYKAERAEEIRQRTAAFVERVGLLRASRLFQVAWQSLRAFTHGVVVRRGTMLAIELGLAEFDVPRSTADSSVEGRASE